MLDVLFMILVSPEFLWFLNLNLELTITIAKLGDYTFLDICVGSCPSRVINTQIDTVRSQDKLATHRLFALIVGLYFIFDTKYMSRFH